VTRTLRPSPSVTTAGSSRTASAVAVSFACKVEETGAGAEEYEVSTEGGAAYNGGVEVSFYDYAGSGDIFPPSGCTAQAAG
jgi:hypothetical protein